eukprot:jgi/Phyca11/510265/fgenesh2_kg.PHYCAscaffold_57_\
MELSEQAPNHRYDHPIIFHENQSFTSCIGASRDVMSEHLAPVFVEQRLVRNGAWFRPTPTNEVHPSSHPLGINTEPAVAT